MDIKKLLEILSGEIHQESTKLQNPYSEMSVEERTVFKKRADETFQAILDEVGTFILGEVVEILLAKQELGFARLSVDSPAFRRISVDCVLKCFVDELIRRAEESEKKPS